MANNPLEDILNGVGLICEMAGLLRDNLMKNGFTREESVTIASQFVMLTFRQADENQKGE